MQKTVNLSKMNDKQLIKFFDDYCRLHEIKLGSKEAHNVWWSMFYAHKEGREWVLQVPDPEKIALWLGKKLDAQKLRDKNKKPSEPKPQKAISTHEYIKRQNLEEKLGKRPGKSVKRKKSEIDYY